jgi:predicted small metal-binding protein
MAKVNDPKHPETGTTHTHSDEEHYSFRCADAGLSECQWQTNGSKLEEMMRNAEEGKGEHSLTATTDGKSKDAKEVSSKQDKSAPVKHEKSRPTHTDERE